MTTVRRLADADRAAILAFLAPTESCSTFLVGNARERSIDDNGGAIEGVWLGAFDDSGKLCGVLAQFRGPQSWIPACEGHADLLVPLMVEAAGRPRVIIGTRERVDEVMRFVPSTWVVQKRKAEVLLALRWDRFVAPDDIATEPLTAEQVTEASHLIDRLQQESGLPFDSAVTRAQTERLAREGRARVRCEGGSVVAISCEAAATGRFAHVGSTMCLRHARRRGHASACVADVVMRAREGGRASEGAVLFTGEDNVAAIAMYERLGFRREAAWDLCFVVDAP